MQPNRRPTTPTARPSDAGAASVLLAEDDPPSRAFLDQALQSLGLAVRVCASGAHALSSARSHRFDLLLIDRNLPPPDGETLLRQLRQDPLAASQGTCAVACSADWDKASRLAARRAGFADVLAKPCSVSDLQSIVQRYLPASASPLVDDARALAAAGSEKNLAALRRLFDRELQQLESRLESGQEGLITDHGVFDQQLHRLVASCGFCGATALATEAATLRQRMRDGADEGPALEQFRVVLSATRERIKAA